MAKKALASGAANAPWKRLRSGVFVPGNMGLPSGTAVRAVQELIQRVYLAAGSRPMTVVCSAELVELIGGVVSRQYNLCTNRNDYTQTVAGSRPTYTASDPGLGGKPCVSSNGVRYLFNATDPAGPSSGTPWYQKSVCRLDSWPPGAKTWYGSTANRFGVFTRGTPDSINLSNASGGASDPVDQPLGRWGVMTFRMGNSSADFLRFGATANTATGHTVGSTNPTSLGKFAIADGTRGVTGSEAIQFVWTQDLTTSQDHAVDDEFNTYFGSGLLIYSTVGNIRSSGMAWLGSSQTYFTQGLGVNYQGARYRYFTNFVTTLNYPIWTTGHTAAGNWAQPAHDGQSGLGINIDTNGPNPGAGLAAANAYLTAAGASPNGGAGAYAAINLELGGADVNGGVYTPVTTADNLLSIAKAIATANPRGVVGINTICAQQGNPAGVAQLTAEIRNVGTGVWDTFDAWAAANGRPNCARVDLFQVINAGVWVGSLFVDGLHLNQTGQYMWGDEINTQFAAPLAAATTY